MESCSSASATSITAGSTRQPWCPPWSPCAAGRRPAATRCCSASAISRARIRRTCRPRTRPCAGCGRPAPTRPTPPRGRRARADDRLLRKRLHCHLQHAGIVNRLPAGSILDRVSATRAVGDDQFIPGRLAHSRQQRELGHLHRNVVMRGLVAEGSHHSAAARLDRFHLQARDELERLAETAALALALCSLALGPASLDALPKPLDPAEFASSLLVLLGGAVLAARLGLKLPLHPGGALGSLSGRGADSKTLRRAPSGRWARLMREPRPAGRRDSRGGILTEMRTELFL